MTRKKPGKKSGHDADRWILSVEAGNIGIYDRDYDTNTVFYSDAYLRNLGYAPGEWGNSPLEWSSRVHPDDYERVLEADLSAFGKKTGSVSVEYRLQHKDGSWRWILDRGAVIEWDSMGRHKRAVGTHTDITERKEVEEKLRRSEDQFRSLMEQVPVALGLAGPLSPQSGPLPTTRILYYNRRWRELFGFDVEDVRTVEEATRRLYPDPAYRTKMFRKRRAAIRAALKTSSPAETFEARIRTADGQDRLFLTGTVFLDELMVVSMEDVTRFRISDDPSSSAIILHQGGSAQYPVGLESIAAVVADGKHSNVLAGDTMIPDHRGIGVWEGLLDGVEFERIDRSTIVRRAWIHAIESIGRGGRISFSHAAAGLDVGRTGRERILKLLKKKNS